MGNEIVINLDSLFSGLLFSIPVTALMLLVFITVDTVLRLGDRDKHMGSIMVVGILLVMMSVFLIAQIGFGVIYMARWVLTGG